MREHLTFQGEGNKMFLTNSFFFAFLHLLTTHSLFNSLFLFYTFLYMSISLYRYRCARANISGEIILYTYALVTNRTFYVF